MRRGTVINDKDIVTNLHITDNDIDMVWQAWATNMYQSFVNYKFDSGQIERKKSEVVTDNKITEEIN